MFQNLGPDDMKVNLQVMIVCQGNILGTGVIMRVTERVVDVNWNGAITKFTRRGYKIGDDRYELHAYDASAIVRQQKEKRLQQKATSIKRMVDALEAKRNYIAFRTEEDVEAAYVATVEYVKQMQTLTGISFWLPEDA